MENPFTIPARPWTDADVAYLTRNADLCPADVKEELGIVSIEVDNNFQADFDAANTSVEPTVEETIVVTQEILDENPVLAEAGIEVGTVGVVTDEAPEEMITEEKEGGLPTEVEGEVVENNTTDNV